MAKSATGGAACPRAGFVLLQPFPDRPAPRSCRRHRKPGSSPIPWPNRAGGTRASQAKGEPFGSCVPFGSRARGACLPRDPCPWTGLRQICPGDSPVNSRARQSAMPGGLSVAQPWAAAVPQAYGLTPSIAEALGSPTSPSPLIGDARSHLAHASEELSCTGAQKSDESSDMSMSCRELDMRSRVALSPAAHASAAASLFVRCRRPRRVDAVVHQPLGGRVAGGDCQ